MQFGSIYKIKETETAKTATKREESWYLRISPHLVELKSTIVIGIGKIAGSWPEIPGQSYLKTHLSQDCHSLFQPFFVVDLASRRYDPDTVSRAERLRERISVH